jgi:Homeodomain-like domain
MAEEMKILRDQGLSYKGIAAKVRFSKYAVRTNLIKSYGFDAIEHQFTHVNSAMFEEMKILRDQGLSTRKIAAIMRLCKSTVASWLKGYNVTAPISFEYNFGLVITKSTHSSFSFAAYYISKSVLQMMSPQDYLRFPFPT